MSSPGPLVQPIGQSVDGTSNFLRNQIIQAINNLSQIDKAGFADLVTSLTAIALAFSTAFPVTFLIGSKTYDPPSIASGAQTTTTLTITGAVFGDKVLPAFSLDIQGLILTAYVSAANTVTFILANLTGGPIDLASGTISAKVLS